jgi:hypothetical protein
LYYSVLRACGNGTSEEKRGVAQAKASERGQGRKKIPSGESSRTNAVEEREVVEKGGKLSVFGVQQF